MRAVASISGGTVPRVGVCHYATRVDAWMTLLTLMFVRCACHVAVRCGSNAPEAIDYRSALDSAREHECAKCMAGGEPTEGYR